MIFYIDFARFCWKYGTHVVLYWSATNIVSYQIDLRSRLAIMLTTVHLQRPIIIIGLFIFYTLLRFPEYFRWSFSTPYKSYTLCRIKLFYDAIPWFYISSIFLFLVLVFRIKIKTAYACFVSELETFVFWIWHLFLIQCCNWIIMRSIVLLRKFIWSSSDF